MNTSQRHTANKRSTNVALPTLERKSRLRHICVKMSVGQRLTEGRSDVAADLFRICVFIITVSVNTKRDRLRRRSNVRREDHTRCRPR